MREPAGELTRRTVRGMAWTSVGSISTAVFQIVYVAVMARLLTPRDFGLIAMANVVIGLTNQLSRFGVGPAVIQRPALRPTTLTTATTLSWSLGAIGTVGIVALAPAAGWAYDDPDVVPVLAVLAVAVGINSLGLVSEAMLRRELRFRRLVTIEVASYAIGYLGVGIGSALAGAGVWSLVATTLTQALIKTTWLLASDRRGARLGWNRAEARAIAGFGSQVTGIGLLHYAAFSLPTVAIGRVLGAGPLGQYNRADVMVNYPLGKLSGSISQVMFPALSSVNRQPGRFAAGYDVAVGAVAAVLVPGALFAALHADDLVTLVLGPGWEQAAAILPIIAGTAALAFLTHFPAVALEALGALKGKLVTEAVAGTLLAVGLLLFTDRGLIAVCLTVLAAEGVRFVAIQWLLGARLGRGPGRLVAVLTPSLLLGGGVGVASVLARWLTAGSPAAVSVTAGGLLSGVAVLGLLWLPPFAPLRDELLARYALLRHRHAVVEQPPGTAGTPSAAAGPDPAADQRRAPTTDLDRRTP